VSGLGAVSRLVEQGGALLEHLRDEPLQLRTGREAELVGEHPAGLVVGAQRLGLPAGPVQREHLQGAEPFSQGMMRNETVE
jgi:hypothetical protein